MKTVLIMLVINGLFHIPAELTIKELRRSFHNSTSNENNCRKLIQQLSTYNENNNPLYYGYLGCSNMVMAKHVVNPFSKLSYFKKGRKILESAIRSDNKNVELRFLRFSVQTNVPGFLGYSQNLAGDREFLQKSLPAMKDQELKKIISAYLQEHPTSND